MALSAALLTAQPVQAQDAQSAAGDAGATTHTGGAEKHASKFGNKKAPGKGKGHKSGHKGKGHKAGPGGKGGKGSKK